MALNKLQSLRAQRGKGLRQLAEEAGIDASTLVALEKGYRKARLATLGKLAVALEVDVAELLDYLDTTAPERGRKSQAARREKGIETRRKRRDR